MRQRQGFDSTALEKATSQQGESEIPCISQTAPSLYAHSFDCIFATFQT